MLLYDRTPPAVVAAAITLERTAFAVMAIVISGLISYFAVQRLQMPGGWDAVFTLLSIGAVLLLGVLVFIARQRTGDYLGRFVSRIGAMTGRQLESSRVIRFILDVEDVVLDLLRGDRRRLIILTTSAGGLLRHHGVRSVARPVGGGGTGRHHGRSGD